ncbi:MBL fold metallo-hydrolase [Ancylobacter sp. G4_0304]|uniref:MBL fold metallo-hydrolase n=1 Tax=Ancylobacter sp. G4_0304 TaxID=3114289 RepID=UPI0039C71BCD
MTDITRRGLLAGAASLPLLAGAPALSALVGAPGAAQAQTGSGTQVPGLYRYKIGDIEITAINDGARSFPLADGFVKNASRDEVNGALQAAFLPKDQMTIQFNPMLLNTGGKRVLIDTGNGPQAANATVGKLMANLAWAGVKPADIDTVVISHFHGDHINGLRAEDGSLAFPNAEILVPAPEWAFWMDEGQMSRAPEAMKGAFANVRKVFKHTDSRVKPYEWDKEIAPGITSVNAAGHTPGHTAYVVASGDAKLFVQSDITNTPALFVPNPEWQVTFDMDAAKAVETRRKVYDMLAAERMQLTGYHFFFPATGFVEKAGNGYRLVPAPWNPVL